VFQRAGWVLRSWCWQIRSSQDQIQSSLCRICRWLERTIHGSCRHAPPRCLVAGPADSSSSLARAHPMHVRAENGSAVALTPATASRLRPPIVQAGCGQLLISWLDLRPWQALSGLRGPGARWQLHLLRRAPVLDWRYTYRYGTMMAFVRHGVLDCHVISWQKSSLAHSRAGGSGILMRHVPSRRWTTCHLAMCVVLGWTQSGVLKCAMVASFMAFPSWKRRTWRPRTPHGCSSLHTAQIHLRWSNPWYLHKLLTGKYHCQCPYSAIIHDPWLLCLTKCRVSRTMISLGSPCSPIADPPSFEASSLQWVLVGVNWILALKTL
jgi:hypothetical protein